MYSIWIFLFNQVIHNRCSGRQSPRQPHQSFLRQRCSNRYQMFYRKVNLDFYLDEEHITIHPHSIIVDPIVIVVLHFDEILLPPPFSQEDQRQERE